jgi:mRNA interferase YafQ
MRTFRRTSQFRRDVRQMLRRGKDMARLKEALAALACGEALALKYRDHVLVGQYKGTKECRLEPDWLLIYELTDGEVILVRTGSHSDLFEWVGGSPAGCK